MSPGDGETDMGWVELRGMKLWKFLDLFCSFIFAAVVRVFYNFEEH